MGSEFFSLQWKNKKSSWESDFFHEYHTALEIP